MNRNFLMRLWKKGGKCLVIACYIAVTTGLVYAQSSSSKSAKKLNFPVPEDWPIEKRGGIVAPIPTEEYVTIKFEKIDKKFQSMESELSEKINKILSDIKDMEAGLSDDIKKVRGQSVSQAGSGVDLADVLTRLDNIENQVARLDRKVTSKVAELKAQFEEIDVNIASIEKRNKELQALFYKLDEELDYLFANQEKVF